MSDLDALRDAWRARWPDALELWTRFTMLREPQWCATAKDAAQLGLTESFAMIRLVDHTIVLSLPDIVRYRLQDFPLEIMGHEIGHHVLCPADLSDQGRLLARMRRSLPSIEHTAPFLSNLYADLLINDRLRRSTKLRMDEVYAHLGRDSDDALWTLYMRIYELLWSLKKSTLAAGKISDAMEGDAQLGARLIRAYARDWLDGAGRFAALCFPYIAKDGVGECQKILKGWHDLRGSGVGGDPAGLTDIEDGELDGAVHPALDDDLAGVDLEKRLDALHPDAPGGSRGQAREPFEYGEILKAMGIDLSEDEVAIRYYREQAARHLVRFPVREMPQTKEPHPEGIETWDVGSPIQEIDWVESVVQSPTIIPGVTTVKRTEGLASGAMPEKEPVDLDIYVDCSGSMPNPKFQRSFLSLVGAIIALSALRVGSRVQATLWSGAGQFMTTQGFVSDSNAVLRILTGYLGGGTAFPIHKLRDTYASRTTRDRKVHVLVISDDGVTTMWEQDERGNSGEAVARTALEKAGGGGTFVLNYHGDWRKDAGLVLADSMGWRIHCVTSWEALVDFARAFSRENYEVKSR